MKTRAVLLLAICIQGFSQEKPAAYPPSPKRREFVLHILKHGISSNEKQGYFEDYVMEACDWYGHGDKTILLPLLKANTDGAASEALGSFLGEELQNNPAKLLKQLSEFPLKLQIHAASSGVSADGSGWPPSTVKKIRSILDSQLKSPDPAIQRAAKIWIQELNQFERSNKEAP